LKDLDLSWLKDLDLSWLKDLDLSWLNYFPYICTRSFIYPLLTLTIDLSWLDTRWMELLCHPDLCTRSFIYPLDLSWLNFYLYYLESELFYSSLSDTAFYRSSKKNFGHSIRYAKSYADSDFNSKQNKNKRENNLICLSFMDKIKRQIFTLKIKKTDENKEVNYVQSV